MNNKFHTIIFDLDGTLSDSGILTMEAFKQIAPLYGLKIPSKEMIQRTTGFANPEFYFILFPDIPRDIAERVGKLVEEAESKLLPSLSEKLLFKGSCELLLKLKENGFHLCIASTGDKEHVYSILDATGITSLFDVISCGKPDKTEMLCEMTKEKEKSGYLMVGDMKKDFEGARANGILSVGACYGYCKKELSDFDFYIDKPMDLLQLIKLV